MQTDWSRVSPDHVRQACALFDANESVPSHQPRNTFLLIGGRRYPAKFIRGLAFKLATGTKPGVYYGGAETVSFFGRLGLVTEYHRKVVAPLRPEHPVTRAPTPAIFTTASTPGKAAADDQEPLGGSTVSLIQFCEQLVHPAQLHTWAELSMERTLLPKSAGVYAWWFREVPPGVPTDGTEMWGLTRLLYVGIAPSNPMSKSNLRKRVIRSHFGGNASGSTLRLTLGCLLAEQLSIQLQPTGSTGRLTFGDGEAKLTAWMAQNAFVSWVEHKQPWVVEAHAIGSLCLPLNLDQNQRSTFHRELSELRGHCKAAARGGKNSLG